MNLAETHVLAAGKVATLLAASLVAATANETGIAVTPPARGHAAAILSVANVQGTLPTFDFKLQSSDDNSTNWTDIPGAAAVQTTTVANVQMIPFLAGAVGKYVRAVVTIGGTSTPEYYASAALVYFGP
jgi:hypothetical protein